MNYTMITAAIVTILATLVAGSGAFTTTAQSADAYNKNDHNGNNNNNDDDGGNSQEGTRATGQPVPGECEACFDPLTANQKSDVEEVLPNRFPGITTIEQLCTFLRNQVLQGLPPIESINTVGEILESEEVNQNTISSITSCVLRAVT
jgi:hypothetical protein